MKFIRVTISILIISLRFLSAADPEGEKYFVYVSLRDDNAIRIYELNSADGGLKHIEEFKVDGGPASMCFNRDKNILYVAQRSSDRFSSFKIDSATGRLSFLNSVSAVDNPVFISTDKANKFLFSVYYAAGKFGLYKLAGDGSIADSAVQEIGGYVNPHSVLVDAANRFVFIADKSGDKIYQYRFAAADNRIVPNNPAIIVTDKNTGPRHFVFNNENSVVYFVNENSSSVSAFHFNGDDGKLGLFQTISTLPNNFRGTNTCADIHLTPGNKFLYASNRGHDSIARFAVDKKSGRLKFRGMTLTVKTPRAFEIDPSGNFLIAAGEDSGELEIYRINKETGDLTSLSSFYAGNRPSWVTILRFDKVSFQ